MAQQGKPNIVVIFGDDIGMWNVGLYTHGMMGRTPSIDRIGREGVLFTDHYGQPSCTAGRAAFIMGQLPVRTGMTTIGIPGSARGIQKEDPTLAEVLKSVGYATGQFGKNHLGDRDEFLPTLHGFDEWFGNLYHLNAEEEPEELDYPGQKNPEYKKWNEKSYPSVPYLFNLLMDPMEKMDPESHEWGYIGRKFFASKLWAPTAAGPFLAAHLKSLKDFPPSQGADTLSMHKAVEEAMRKLETPHGSSN
jgi:arylsulfatase A-like enzyme